MLCQICKRNPAIVHIQEIANGKRRTLHLCGECAGQRIFSDPSMENAPFQDMISEVAKSLSEDSPDNRGIIDNLRKIFGDQAVESLNGQTEKEQVSVCPACGWNAVQFKKTGHLGCPACYDALKEVIEPMFHFEQHGSGHCGKIPDCPVRPELSDTVQIRLNKRLKLEELQKNMSEAVQREEYELAAELRDKIASIEVELSETGAV